MDVLTIDQIKILVEKTESQCVSIYMPTIRAGAETQQNPIRFKNLIKQAEIQLKDQGLRQTDALSFLEPALNIDQEGFWQHQDQGLALFISNDFLQYYCLPMPVEELVVVSDRFQLNPLLPLLTRDNQFYILALSQKQVRLFAATRYSIQEVEVEGMPHDIDSALQYDETAKDGQFRISTSRGGTSNAAQQAGSFHGQGSPDRDQHQKDILQFYYLVDQAVTSKLGQQQAPLVLATVDHLQALYHEANTYEHLLDEGINTENPVVVQAKELHERVLPLLEPFFSQAEQSAIEQYYELSNTDKTSTDLKEVIPAAFYGRIDRLFIPLGVHQWGTFDPQASTLQTHADFEPGDDDLLNAAAIQTLLASGEVYAIEPEKIPDAAPLAAIFRY